MKKLVFIISILCMGSMLSAQDKYHSNMQEAFHHWEGNEMDEAHALFSRISQAEKEKWIPPYYAANVLIVQSFQSDSTELVNKLLSEAKKYIEIAKERSPDNSEIITLEGLLYTAYVAMDPATYGRQYSSQIISLHKKAIGLDNENPRARANLIEYEMGSAKFYGEDLKTYCKRMKEVIPLFENQSTEIPFAPSYGIERAKEIIQKCK